jgi:prephenate dehydratase/chorismate mutase/prephenate dehydratase
LLTLPGVDYKDIKAVYSHPQAISQCRSFIERNKLEGRPYYDTAGAAKMLGSSIPANSAVIASLRCAQLYGLEIIKEGIEDHKENYTRFVVISKKENAPTVKLLNKTSIIFSLPDRAGTLFEVLKLFSEADMNLTRIESMPRRDLPGSYYFFLDFIGNSYDKKTVNILAEIEKVSTKYNFLGCYKGV